MRREQIPVQLRVARGADIDRMPLAKMASPAEVTARLLAADEFRRRARVPRLDPDLYRHRIRQATDVLTTSDPAEAAGLVKAAGVSATPEQSAAGVPGWVHRPFDGTHSHPHAAWDGPDADGDGGHTHRHTHRNDANHHHRHAAVKSAPSTRPVLDGALAKAAVPPRGRQLAPGEWRIRSGGGPPVVVSVPVLKSIASDSKSVIQRAANEGQLSALAAEITACARATGESAALAKAAEYRRKAAQMSSPADRSAYLELAEQAERAGAL